LGIKKIQPYAIHHLSTDNCFFLAFSTLYAHNGSINGQVTEENGLELTGATVQLDPGALHTTTNELGFFNFPNLPAGTYTVTVQFLGFETSITKEVRVRDSETSTLRIEMLTAPLDLRTVEISNTHVARGLQTVSTLDIQTRPVPIFHTGVPNFPPYQLATGKNGNPLAPGKPFINNFLPNGGDMLRLNMAVPVTQRNDPNFSSLGIVLAAVLGLTNPQNANTNLQFIPNMDGFPNGRRLEDDVTRIALQAVSGVALAAIGLWYDDYNGSNPVSQNLLDVLTYTTGVEKNDATFKNRLPYIALPWAGDGVCGSKIASINASGEERSSAIGIQPAQAMMSNYPNPFQRRKSQIYQPGSTDDSNIAGSQ
jgi:hypothetical protein